MKMKKLSGLALSAVMVSTTVIGIDSANNTAGAAEFTFRFGLLTKNDAQHWWAQAFQKRVAEVTKGRVEVKIFPRGQLGGPGAHVEGLRLGSISATMVPIDFFAGVDARAGVFSIPFMFKDLAHANRALQDKALYESTLEMFKGKGIAGGTIVGLADGKYIARKPILKLADFKGKKLRVNATDAERERFKRLGATAVPMGLGQMVTSLQTGVIDGTMSGISIHVNFKLDTISKVLLKTEDTLLITYAGLSQKYLDGLPDGLGQTILKAANAMQPEALAAAAKEDKVLTKKWLDRGGKIVTITPAELKKMHALLDSVGEQVTNKTPELKSYFQFVKKIAAKY